MNNDFEKNGYYIAREFLDKTTVGLLSTYFNLKYKVIKHGDFSASSYSSLDQGGSANSHYFYGDTFTESILINNGQRISNILGLNLSPTYSLTRIYEIGEPLLPHYDRPACEISTTSPIYISDNRPSEIYVSSFRVVDKPKRYTLNEIMATGDYTKVSLYPGDVLFYKGCDRYHWRLPLESEYLIQFFMHLVQTEGDNKDWIYDTRPFPGFSEKHCNYNK